MPALTSMVPPAYLLQGGVELTRRRSQLSELLSSQALPSQPWPEGAIVSLLHELSSLDSNNATGGVGAGEREGRVWSSLVRTRHWGFAHGVGRSGDITASQPKAPGSSLLQALCNRLALHAARQCGLLRTQGVVVFPLATGMTLSLCLTALRSGRRQGGASTSAIVPTYVIWPRCDQKSCLKSILTAGMVPIVVENTLVGEELRTDVGAIRAAVEGCGGPAHVVAILTTTSCFAPRAPDRVGEVGALCAALDIPHLVNHAYGLQAPGLCSALNEACRGWPPPAATTASATHSGKTVGGGAGATHPPPCRVDAWVSSTDKNFMVPVGGALVGSPCPATLARIAQMYPGRASMAPIMDLFITLLSMGRQGLAGLLTQRKAAFDALRVGLEEEAGRVGERLILTPHNPISMALTLGALCGGSDATATHLGSMLFSRGVSGTRVVPLGKSGGVEGMEFKGYGSHCNAYPHGPYLTAAAAMGMTLEDVALFKDRLGRALKDYTKFVEKRRVRKGGGGGDGGEEEAVGGGDSSITALT